MSLLMRKLNELRLRHWQRVAQLGFWRWTLLCTLTYGVGIASMLALAIWWHVPHPNWIRFSTTALPLLLVGGFLFGVAEYSAKMWLYKRHQRTFDSTAPTI